MVLTFELNIFALVGGGQVTRSVRVQTQGANIIIQYKSSYIVCVTVMEAVCIPRDAFEGQSNNKGDGLMGGLGRQKEFRK